MMVSAVPPKRRPRQLELGRPRDRAVRRHRADRRLELLQARINGYGMHLIELTELVYPAQVGFTGVVSRESLGGDIDTDKSMKLGGVFEKPQYSSEN